MDENEEFKVEIIETLELAETALLAYETYGDSDAGKALYDEVFRAFHNIKGAAGMLEWTEVQNHIHALETTLMQTKDTSTIPVNKINWFLKGCDVAKDLLEGKEVAFNYESESNQAGKQSEEVPSEFYAEVSEAMERLGANLLKIEKDGGSQNSLNEIYRDVHSSKGAVQLFGFKAAATLAHSMENCLEHYREKNKTQLSPTVTELLFKCIDLFCQKVKDGPGSSCDEELNSLVKKLDQVTNDIGDDKVESVVPPKGLKVSDEIKKDKQDSSIRVQVSLLDKLMGLMGEMVLVRNQLLQYSNGSEDLEFLNLIQKLNNVTGDLQEETMKTRMQPIGSVLNKFQRVVRDLSNELGKQINLELEGVETELDKSLVEAIKDPLMHIVRNACDHGIEMPGDRAARGKDSCGIIRITAFHEGGQVVINISDDGKGLSREKIVEKAISKGLGTQLQLEEFSDQEINNLIFAPGFSTAEKVTNLSGRGVGMDVVKSNIEKIGGNVTIKSEEGQGSVLTLKIPLTLAIVPALIVKSAEDCFSIPQVKLVELCSARREQVEALQGKPIFRLRERILPLLDLKDIFQKSEEESEQSNEDVNIVVVKSETETFGLIVDEILDTVDIVVKPLAKFLDNLGLYSGATVLGDGSVSLILDIPGIAKRMLGRCAHVTDPAKGEKQDFASREISRDYLLFNLYGSPTKHAVALEKVWRMEEFEASKIEISGNKKVVRYRGGVLEIIMLDQILNSDFNDKKPEDDEIINVIVVEFAGKYHGLWVKDIIDVHKSSRSVEIDEDNHPVIKGSIPEEDGLIVLLEVSKILKSSGSFKEVMTNKTLDILLVEDTRSIQNKVRGVLEELGHRVECACDGVEGLKAIAKYGSKFDLIISDIDMPRLDGFGFAQKVKGLRALRDIPLIAFTTKNGKEDVIKAREVGFDFFLEKSRLQTMPEVIKECLNLGPEDVA